MQNTFLFVDTNVQFNFMNPKTPKTHNKKTQSWSNCTIVTIKQKRATKLSENNQQSKYRSN